MMIMGGGSLHLLHVLVMLLLVMKLEFGFNSRVRGEANIRCIEKEREALLKFKQGLVDDYGHLSSWGSEDPKRDCCKWRGITCSNRTNHVIKLNLYVTDFSVSYNPLRGTIPHCLNNFIAMSEKGSLLTISVDYLYSQDGQGRYATEYDESALVVMKGLQLEYERNLGLVKSIDLSSNKLAGEIPEEIASLMELVNLNLSRNNLSGQITPKIGQLKMLESLDLSQNRLFGEIPASLSALNFLSVLDLSNNNLSGKIPIGTQLQSFNPSSYMGNLDLCGPPLPNKCETAQHPPISGGFEEIEDGFITPGFYVSMGLGFTIGFWGVCATLLFKSSWRYAYFQFLNEMRDWLYVIIVVNAARLQRRLKAKWEMLHL